MAGPMDLRLRGRRMLVWSEGKTSATSAEKIHLDFVSLSERGNACREGPSALLAELRRLCCTRQVTQASWEREMPNDNVTFDVRVHSARKLPGVAVSAGIEELPLKTVGQILSHRPPCPRNQNSLMVRVGAERRDALGRERGEHPIDYISLTLSFWISFAARSIVPPLAALLRRGVRRSCAAKSEVAPPARRRPQLPQASSQPSPAMRFRCEDCVIPEGVRRRIPIGQHYDRVAILMKWISWPFMPGAPPLWPKNLPSPGASPPKS